MTALEWKKIIEKPNNSTFLKREKGRSGTGSIYVFSATPAAAKAILKDAEQEYPKNDVEMKIRKRSSEGNTYEIYVWLGEKEKFANEKLAQELAKQLLKLAKELVAKPWLNIDRLKKLIQEDPEKLSDKKLVELRSHLNAFYGMYKQDNRKAMAKGGFLVSVEGVGLGIGNTAPKDAWLYTNLLSAREAMYEEIKKRSRKKADKVAKELTATDTETLIAIGFGQQKDVKRSWWAKSVKIMEQLAKTPYVEKRDIGRGKGKYWGTKELDAKGLKGAARIKFLADVFEGKQATMKMDKEIIMNNNELAEELLNLAKELTATKDGNELTDKQVKEVVDIYNEMTRICVKYSKEAAKYASPFLVKRMWGVLSGGSNSLTGTLLKKLQDLDKRLQKIAK